MVVANANLAPKVRASPAHRATPRPHHAAMVPKARHALKARARVAVKPVAAKNDAVIRVLTAVLMAKAVPHRVVHAQKAVVLPVVVKVAKTAVATTVMNCHATSTL